MRLDNMQKASCNPIPRHKTSRLMRPELLCEGNNAKILKRLELQARPRHIIDELVKPRF
jgi:hypothetical protein